MLLKKVKCSLDVQKLLTATFRCLQLANHQTNVSWDVTSCLLLGNYFQREFDFRNVILDAEITVCLHAQ